MVAPTKFVSAYDPAGLTDYYMRETQPQQERDRDREAERLPVIERDGTVPELRQDAPARVYEAFGIDDPSKPLEREQVRNLIAGHRADGEPTGRRVMPDYTRGDGKEFQSKEFMDVTISTDISFGIALANAETQEGRGLILAATRAAGDDAMKAFAGRMGWTRRGAGGSGGEQQGHLLWVRFTHHTARPARDGSVSPSLHMHYIVPNGVVLDAATASGRPMVRAMHMKKIMGFMHETGNAFHDSLAVRMQKLGSNISRHAVTGSVILSDVPKHIREHFSRRSADMLEYAQDLNRQRNPGQDWDALPQREKSRLMRAAWLPTQGRRPAAHDGMAQTHQWRSQMSLMGWKPSDVAWPIYAAATMLAERVQENANPTRQQTRQPTRQLTILERAQDLKQKVSETCRIAKSYSRQMDHPSSAFGLLLKPSLIRTVELAKLIKQKITPINQIERLRKSTQELRTISRGAMAAASQKMRNLPLARGMEPLTNSLNDSFGRINKMVDHQRYLAMAQHYVAINKIEGPKDLPERLASAVRYVHGGGAHRDAVMRGFSPQVQPAFDAIPAAISKQAMWQETVEARARVQERAQATTPATPTTKPAEPDTTERMLRIYARKVDAGEMSITTATNIFVAAELRQNRVGTDPVHKTPIYGDGPAVPEKRDALEDKWSNRLMDRIELAREGKLWADVMAPRREAAQQARQIDLVQPRQAMRMER